MVMAREYKIVALLFNQQYGCGLVMWALLFAVGSVSAQTAKETTLNSKNNRVIQVTVEKGDQLGSLAQRYLQAPASKNWKEIAKLNHIPSPYKLKPGAAILLPMRLMAWNATTAKWISVTGQIKVSQKGTAGVFARVGDSVYESAQIAVGDESFGVLELADGSQIKLLAKTQAVLEEHRFYNGRASESKESTSADKQESFFTKAFSGLLRLIQGSIEARATKASDRAQPLRIQTPTSVVGVRGTQFRVSHDGIAFEGTNKELISRVEVVEGAVQAQLDDTRITQVSQGYGLKLDPSSKLALAAVPLLAAPDVSSWKLLQESATLVFPETPSQNNGQVVQGYRLQIATDASISANSDPFAQIVYDRKFVAAAPLHVLGLPDGVWNVRVRAIDAQGIEGFDAVARVRLKARPEPPLTSEPKANAKLLLTPTVSLKWAGIENAIGYSVELLDDKNRRNVFNVETLSLGISELAVGEYRWRIASKVKLPNGQIATGPWSDVQSFSMIAAPSGPQAKTLIEKNGGTSFDLTWSSQGAANYEVQVSSNVQFSEKEGFVKITKTDKPELSYRNPPLGISYIRYRALESDGQIGVWSNVTKVAVPVVGTTNLMLNQ